MSGKKDTFCIMPFHHINIKNEGKISTCWRYPNWIGDFTEVKLKEAWNGDCLLYTSPSPRDRG